jgi:hypothetical protein
MERRRWSYVIGVAALLALAAAAISFVRISDVGAALPSAIPQTGAESVKERASSTVTFEVSVPSTDTSVTAVPHQVTQGDTVNFVVTSSRPGMVAIHGLSEEVSVRPSHVARLSVVASRVGRFPLHFHSTEGAHFAISGLDVYPRD